MRTGNSPHDKVSTQVAIRGSRNAPHELATLREHWMDEITDLVSGVPPKVPPFRMVNHEINLIDPDKRINY